MRVECDRFDRWASLYRDHRLPGRARTAVERHLGFCQNCAARFEAYVAALDQARTAPIPSSLIPPDVTHQIPPRKLPFETGTWKRTAGGLVFWLIGLAVLTALLAAAFVLGFRTGIRHALPACEPVVEEKNRRLVGHRPDRSGWVAEGRRPDSGPTPTSAPIFHP